MLNRKSVYRPVMYECFANFTDDNFPLVEHLLLQVDPVPQS